MLHKMLNLLVLTTKTAVWCLIFASLTFENGRYCLYDSELLINSASSVGLRAEIKPESQSPHPAQVGFLTQQTQHQSMFQWQSEDYQDIWQNELQELQESS